MDWGQTRAYGLGLNGLYLNQRGREPDGIVAAGDNREETRDQLISALLAVRDPLNGQPVVARVFRPEQIYSGPHLAKAPDLIVGYHRDYRASWDTVLGHASAGTILDNTDPWSGDHANDPQYVPGVLLANRRIQSATPGLEDIAPSILTHFGLHPPKEMNGRSFFSR